MLRRAGQHANIVMPDRWMISYQGACGGLCTATDLKSAGMANEVNRVAVGRVAEWLGSRGHASGQI